MDASRGAAATLPATGINGETHHASHHKAEVLTNLKINI